LQREFEVGNYQQTIEIEKGKLIKLWCTCKHHSLYPKNWKEGKTLCWHLRTALINLRRQDEREETTKDSEKSN